MFVPNATCKACGLYKGCKNPGIATEVLGPDGQPLPLSSGPLDLLFVGDSPGVWEDDAGRPFMGKVGKFFRDYLKAFPGLKIGMVHSVRCRTTEVKPWGEVGDRAAEKGDIDHCRPYILNTLMKYDPKIVILLGAAALTSVWEGGPKTISQAKVSPTYLNGRWFLTTYHPSMHVRKKRDLKEDYRSLGKLITKILNDTYIVENPDIREVKTNADWALFIKQLTKAKRVYFDFENNTWDYGAKWPEMQTFYQAGRTVTCLGVGTSKTEPVWVLTPPQIAKILPLLEGKTLVAFNALYDLAVFDWFYSWRQVWEQDIDDPFLMHISMDSGRMGNSLEELSYIYLHVPSWKQPVYAWIKEENARRHRDKNTPYIPATIADMPWPMLMGYNGRDVYYLMQVDEQARKMKIPEAYKTRYIRFLKALGKVQSRGIPCDKTRAEVVKEAYERKLDFLIDSLQKSPEVRAVLQEYEEEEFNVRSPIQCTRLLERLQIATGKTDSGKYAKFDRATRQYLAVRHSLIRRLHVIRTYLDMISKFLTRLPHYVASDGRVHSFYTLGKADSTFPVGSDPQGGTSTNRVSSRTPAMHNIKKDNMLRSCFVAPPGYVFVEMDYKAAEPRGLAQFAGVKRLIQWFNEDKDPYIMLMAIIDQVPYEVMWEKYVNPETRKATKLRRDKTKTAFLAWQYGSGMDNFAFVLGVNVYTAERVYKTFDSLFPEVRPFQKRMIEDAKAGKTLTTVWGCQRKFTVDNSHEENQVKNYLIQSSCSDITVSLIDIIEEQVGDELFATVNVIHDALYGLVPEHRLEEAVQKVKALMENPPGLPFKLLVKLEVEVKVGRNMGQMEGWLPPVCGKDA